MPFQLALDEVLFHRAKKNHGPTLRFYFSSEPWSTLGYSQKGFHQNGIPACRRITGGGKVLHGKDLIFSLTSQKEHDEIFSSVRMSYLKIHEAVKLAFESLGKTAEFYRCDENLPRGKDCFLFPIATDLRLGKHKIAGGAQKRSHGALLHEESIKLEGVDADALTKTLRQAFEKIFQMKIIAANLEPAWLNEAKAVAAKKYSPQGFLS